MIVVLKTFSINCLNVEPLTYATFLSNQIRLSHENPQIILFRHAEPIFWCVQLFPISGSKGTWECVFVFNQQILFEGWRLSKVTICCPRPPPCRSCAPIFGGQRSVASNNICMLTEPDEIFFAIPYLKKNMTLVKATFSLRIWSHWRTGQL